MFPKIFTVTSTINLLVMSTRNENMKKNKRRRLPLCIGCRASVLRNGKYKYDFSQKTIIFIVSDRLNVLWCTMHKHTECRRHVSLDLVIS